MENDQVLYLIDNASKLAVKCMFQARSLHKTIFNDYNELHTEKTKMRICFELVRITFDYPILKSLYIQNEELQRLDNDDFLIQFEVFIDEVKTNFVTDHSHQWSDIEYRTLVETFNQSSFALNQQEFLFEEQVSNKNPI